ncbi:hypothetical protein H6P81_000331 [Aristolochia fimbriata]|uniref:ENTH domain-containing protein n=1 Tax=Aristolochia fimbriata TaxID=158543 RepID=A0AAV7F8B9_ARIFI|nr:hypothetical protein H6P81_000331 [Aristolochia fimbriata]
MTGWRGIYNNIMHVPRRVERKGSKRFSWGGAHANRLSQNRYSRFPSALYERNSLSSSLLSATSSYPFLLIHVSLFLRALNPNPSLYRFVIAIVERSIVNIIHGSCRSLVADDYLLRASFVVLSFLHCGVHIEKPFRFSANFFLLHFADEFFVYAPFRMFRGRLEDPLRQVIVAVFVDSSSFSEIVNKMAGVGNTQLRKAFGVLKDSTKVGLAKVNSDYKELDVAIVKATNHVEDMAKEKHIRTIFDATVASRPRADVAYCIQALARRLAKTQNWAVALKTLIVIHRALREADHTFRDELISYSKSRVRMLNVSHFKDDSSPNAWDYSAWVRSYALFLEEKLECYRLLKYDVEAEPCKIKGLLTSEMLDHLSALQQLLFRLLSCKPEGAAVSNNVIQYALSIVVGESVKLYNAINDGTLNLVDKFFEMQPHDAVRALDIYKRAGHQAEVLSEFYETCKGIHYMRGQKFMKVEQPPASFAIAMEEYVNGAAQASPCYKMVVYEERSVTPKAVKAIEYKRSQDVQDPAEPSSTAKLGTSEHSEPSASGLAPSRASASAVSYLNDDLLGLNAPREDASELDEKYDRALAMVTDKPSVSENEYHAANPAADWELALVAGPTSNGNAAVTNKLAGGFDRLTLDSLYNDALTRQTNINGGYHTGQVAPSPFATAQYSQDPFYASNNIAPPSGVQMAAMAQQQQAMMMGGGQNSLNPFGNPYAGTGMQSYQSSNPYAGFL